MAQMKTGLSNSMLQPATKKSAPDTPSVQSLDRGLTILEAVAQSEHPVPIRDLNQILGLNRSSVFRLANTLRRRGFLANPNGRNDYIIGPAIWRLFRNYDWSMLVSLCRHELRLLANLTGETVHLAVRERHLALFVDHHTPRNEIIAVSGRTGEFMPLHCTAHGKALLADCDLAALKSIFGESPLETHTRQTVSSIQKLAEACAEVKARGYAVDNAEFLEEVRCVAAPIRDKDGAIVAAIGVSAPVARLSPERLPATARRVVAAARDITEIFSK